MLPRSFFRRDPVTCARDLIGCELHWGARAGIIVETEAYDSEGDEASHTFFRPSSRLFVENHQPGTAYVYLNYGMHWMLNVLVRGKRHGFVLFRGLQPVHGIDEMFAARKVKLPHQLASGPGKLAQAMGVTGEHHGMDLCADPRFAFHARNHQVVVREGPRIGITRSVDLPWRFWADANPHVSGSRKKNGTGRGFPDRS